MDAVEYLKTLRRICKEYTPVCPDLLWLDLAVLLLYLKEVD